MQPNIRKSRLSFANLLDSDLWWAMLNAFIYKALEVYMGKGETLQVANITAEIRKDYVLRADKGVVVLNRYSESNLDDGISRADQHEIVGAAYYRKIIELKRRQGKNGVL